MKIHSNLLLAIVNTSAQIMGYFSRRFAYIISTGLLCGIGEEFWCLHNAAMKAMFITQTLVFRSV